MYQVFPQKSIIVVIHLFHLGVPEYATLNVFIFAITSAGKGPSSQIIINIVTGSMPILLSNDIVYIISLLVPSAPRNLSGYALNTSAVSLSWEHPEFPNGKLLSYQMYYRASENNEQVRSYWNQTY